MKKTRNPIILARKAVKHAARTRTPSDRLDCSNTPCEICGYFINGECLSPFLTKGERVFGRCLPREKPRLVVSKEMTLAETVKEMGRLGCHLTSHGSNNYMLE